MNETKRKVVAVAALLLILPSCLAGCGKKGTTDSSSVAETTTTTVTETKAPETDTAESESSHEELPEPDKEQGYQIIQNAAENEKQNGTDMKSFRSVITVKGVYSPKTETVVTKAGTSSEESYEETKIEWGEPQDIEAYYTMDVTQAGAHLQGVRYKEGSTQWINAYYVPSSTETTIYYECDKSGIWHKYSSYNEFIIPDYIDEVRDNAKTHFINANIKSTPEEPTNEYVIETKITDDRLVYVNAAFFESIFFTDLSSHNVSGVTSFTLSDNRELKNVSLALGGEQVDVTVSADIYGYNGAYDVSVPADAVNAELIDFDANNQSLWVEEKKETEEAEKTDSAKDKEESKKDDSSSKSDKKSKSKKK